METLKQSALLFFSARGRFTIVCTGVPCAAADLFSALCAGKAKNASNMKKPPGCPDGFLYPFGFI